MIEFYVMTALKPKRIIKMLSGEYLLCIKLASLFSIHFFILN